ncbi:MAG: DUF3078 domain-containing protein [Flavobacteriales bacterium]|nr:DUF3078 domain-containing protein [Flavobacteriales bacterium]
MKKAIIKTFLISAVTTSTVFAQDMSTKDVATAAEKVLAPTADSTKAWDIGGSVALNFGQTYLKSWASGGQNAISIAFTGLAHANYRKGKGAWDNNLVLGVGGIALFPQEKYKDNLNKFPFRKNIDNLQLTSVGSYQVDKKGKWYASGLLDFRSQLLNGFGNYAHADTVFNSDGSIDEISTNPNRINTRTKVSQFAAPAYLTLSAGITYKPVSWVQMYLSPVAGKFTFVNPAANVYNADGSDPNVPAQGATAYGLETPTTVYRAEFGWYFRGNLEKEVFKNVIVKTQIELFGNYLDKEHVDNIAATPKDTIGNFYYDPSTRSQNEQATDDDGNIIYVYDNRINVDVNWQTWITFKINKYLQASLEWQLLYDYDIAVPKYQDDGITTYSSRGVQFREGFTLGLGYVF